jgi:hypothetical protein
MTALVGQTPLSGHVAEMERTNKVGDEEAFWAVGQSMDAGLFQLSSFLILAVSAPGSPPTTLPKASSLDLLLTTPLARTCHNNLPKGTDLMPFSVFLLGLQGVASNPFGSRGSISQ